MARTKKVEDGSEEIIETENHTMEYPHMETMIPPVVSEELKEKIQHMKVDPAHIEAEVTRVVEKVLHNYIGETYTEKLVATLSERLSELTDSTTDRLVTQITERFSQIQNLDRKFLRPERDSIHVLVKKLPHYNPEWPVLAFGTPGSAGVDLRAAISEPKCIAAQEWGMIPSGISIALPPGYVAFGCPRSGLAAKSGISVLNAPGVIDSDYRGEMMTIIVNHSTAKFWVNPGDRIMQMVVLAYPHVNFEYTDTLPATFRGEGGFGSTGTF